MCMSMCLCLCLCWCLCLCLYLRVRVCGGQVNERDTGISEHRQHILTALTCQTGRPGDPEPYFYIAMEQVTVMRLHPPPLDDGMAVAGILVVGKVSHMQAGGLELGCVLGCVPVYQFRTADSTHHGP